MIAVMFELLGAIVGTVVCAGVASLGLTWLTHLDEYVVRSTDELTGNTYTALNVGGYLVVLLGVAGLVPVVRQLVTWI